MQRAALDALERDAGLEVVRELGRGRHASTYLAWDRVERVHRVLKLLGEAHRYRYAMLRRSVSDARRLERLGHPNLLRLVRSGLLHGRPYLVTEYAEDGSASDLLARRGPLPPALAAAMLARAADAVDAAHLAGVVHGALKPSNLFLGSRGLVVGDFGLAPPLRDPNDPCARPWLAPEQRDGRAALPASDVYALGLTLRALVTGLPPDAPAAVADPLGAIVRRATDPSPDHRHPSAAALAQALEDALPTLPPLDPSPEPEPTTAPGAAALQALRRLWAGWAVH